MLGASIFLLPRDWSISDASAENGIATPKLGRMCVHDNTDM